MSKFADQVVERVIRDVSELPDRSSPDDAPEMLLVSGAELRLIIRRALETDWRSRPSGPRAGTITPTAGAISSIRRQRQLQLRVLADRAGTSPGRLVLWNSGAPMSRRSVEHLAEALEIDPAALASILTRAA